MTRISCRRGGRRNFGTWVLNRHWGSRSSRLFGVLQQLPPTLAVAAKTLRTVERRRARSGAGYVHTDSRPEGLHD